MLPSKRMMLYRALRRRCPRCGGGPIFTRWLSMTARCPGCGLVFSRGEDGYGVGAVWFNLLAAEAFSVTVLVGVVMATWPNPPWDQLQYVGPVEALTMPVRLLSPFQDAIPRVRSEFPAE